MFFSANVFLVLVNTQQHSFRIESVILLLNV